MKPSTRMVVLGGRPFDLNAQDYIRRVEIADNMALEEGVKIAINNFVVGCKADDIWSAIKASCILTGARTLGGALVPLVGTAPTNFNFVSSDYNRKTGLMGDGTTKYLNSNRASSAEPQDNCHLSVVITALATVDYATYIGVTNNTATSGSLIRNGFNNNFEFALRTPGVSTRTRVAGFNGVSRLSSGFYTIRNEGINNNVFVASASSTGNIYLFADNFPPPNPRLRANARIAFYSIGESLNLSLLDARVTTLINEYNTAII